MNEYPDSCRKCAIKKKCGYKYREHNRIPRGIGCLFNKKEGKEMTTYEAAEINTKKVENIRKVFQSKSYKETMAKNIPSYRYSKSEVDNIIETKTISDIKELVYEMYFTLGTIIEEVEK